MVPESSSCFSHTGSPDLGEISCYMECPFSARLLNRRLEVPSLFNRLSLPLAIEFSYGYKKNSFREEQVWGGGEL